MASTSGSSSDLRPSESNMNSLDSETATATATAASTATTTGTGSRSTSPCCLAARSNQQDDFDEHVALLRDMRKPLLDAPEYAKSIQDMASSRSRNSGSKPTTLSTITTTTTNISRRSNSSPCSEAQSPKSARCCCHHCRKCGRCTNQHHHHPSPIQASAQGSTPTSPPGSPTLCKCAMMNRSCPGPGATAGLGARIAPAKVKTPTRGSVPAIVAQRASSFQPTSADVCVAIQDEDEQVVDIPMTKATVGTAPKVGDRCSDCACAIVLAQLRATGPFKTINGFSRQFDTSFPAATAASAAGGESKAKSNANAATSTLSTHISEKEFAIAILAINETVAESFPSCFVVLVGYLITLLCLGMNLYCCSACGTFTSQVEASVNQVLARINNKPCFVNAGVQWKFKRSTCHTWIEISLTQVMIDTSNNTHSSSKPNKPKSVPSLIVPAPATTAKHAGAGSDSIIATSNAAAAAAAATGTASNTWSSQRLLLASMRAAPWPQAVHKPEGSRKKPEAPRRATIVRRDSSSQVGSAASPTPASKHKGDTSLSRHASAPPSIMTVYDL